MAVYRTRCDVCHSEFNTTTALIKHRKAKHSGAQAIMFLPFYKGQEMIELPGRTKKGRRSVIYKLWVGGIVESINSCLHSKAMGKWCRVDRFDVPEEYFKALLGDMSNVFLNSAREKRHFRPPVLKDITRVLHFRTYDIDDIVTALGEQSGLKLYLKKTYLGNKEVISAECSTEDGRTALQRAKARAHGQEAKRTPTLQIQIVVGCGEGRATREFELIWWPEMFSASLHGKLTLRFYVSRVEF